MTEIFRPADWLKLCQKLLVMEFPDGEYELIIRPHKEKRSDQANRYAWTLTDKLADKMLMPKEQMHAEMIFRYGQPEIDGDKAVIISANENIDLTQFYAYAKEIGEGEANGRRFKHWKIYRPSSDYTREEFAIFLRGIVEECHEMGIPTETPDEIARMISLMRDKE